MVLLSQRFGVDLLICNEYMVPTRPPCQQVGRKISIDEIELLFIRVVFESDCDLKCDDSTASEEDGAESGECWRSGNQTYCFFRFADVLQLLGLIEKLHVTPARWDLKFRRVHRGASTSKGTIIVVPEPQEDVNLENLTCW